MKNRERSYYVYKKNELIQKSRYSLTLNQNKLLLYLISKIKPTDTENTIYTINIKEYIDICGLNNNGGYYYRSLKSDIKRIADMSAWIEINPNEEILFRWLNNVKIEKNTGNIFVSFHKSVLEYLLNIKRYYTRYSLNNILAMSCKYSIRVYELLLSYSYKNEIELPITEFKKRIDAENYESNSILIKKALIPAIEEINKYTDLFIEYRMIKEGRSFSKIHFIIRQKNNLSNVISRQNIKKKLERTLNIDE